MYILVFVEHVAQHDLSLQEWGKSMKQLLRGFLVLAAITVSILTISVIGTTVMSATRSDLLLDVEKQKVLLGEIRTLEGAHKSAKEPRRSALQALYTEKVRTYSEERRRLEGCVKNELLPMEAFAELPPPWEL